MMEYRVTIQRSVEYQGCWYVVVAYGQDGTTGTYAFNNVENVLKRRTVTRWGAKWAAQRAIRGHRRELRLREKFTSYRVEA